MTSWALPPWSIFRRGFSPPPTQPPWTSSAKSRIPQSSEAAATRCCFQKLNRVGVLTAPPNTQCLASFFFHFYLASFQKVRTDSCSQISGNSSPLPQGRQSHLRGLFIRLFSSTFPSPAFLKKLCDCSGLSAALSESILLSFLSFSCLFFF